MFPLRLFSLTCLATTRFLKNIPVYKGGTFRVFLVPGQKHIFVSNNNICRQKRHVFGRKATSERWLRVLHWALRGQAIFRAGRNLVLVSGSHVSPHVASLPSSSAFPKGCHLQTSFHS